LRKDYGIDIEKPDSDNGKITATYDWKKVEQYQKKWDDWFRHESQEKETREIAEHLNTAAKRMVNDIAAGQVDVVKNAGKLVGAFTRWAEPGSHCKPEAFVTCLQGEGVKHG